MSTVFFRDKTASLDILHAKEVHYWDNNVQAHNLIRRGQVVVVTPMKSNFATREEWLEAPALLATFSGDYEKLNTDTGEWPSGDGGYVHRYHFVYVDNSFQVKHLIERNMDHVDALRQGSVSYRRN